MNSTLPVTTSPPHFNDGAGFPSCLGVKPGHGAPNQQVLIQSNYPVTWRIHYDSQAYAAIDPIVHHCLNSNLRLLWNRENYRQPAESAFFEEAAMHGLQLGLAAISHPWQP
ncbi:autoinducer binding domain-containing protein [Pseudomonas fluorescens]|uniref:autoinducer binding domain-containing protein n=1 Tax=Pseudomonas fluorescens TaxID=294 RepID=UPI0022A9877D|nr:autoinducer binding domain-containing protein [Pseudomonas fluorescens]